LSRPRDFGVPEDEEETNRMLENMGANVIKPPEAEMIIKARKREFEAAVKKYDTAQKKSNTDEKRKKTKNILTK
jgi:hypothetical protein